jgi:predicted CXXCH cytochrome family protein
VLNKVCAISLSLPDRWGRGDRGQRGSHPIGANYQLAKALRPTARLKDIALLPAVIKLEHGSTGCLSCHDPASSYPHMLVIDNTGSRLCYACHDM